MLKAIAVCAFLAAGVAAVNGRNGGAGQQVAQELWERAVVAKGGRCQRG